MLPVASISRAQQRITRRIADKAALIDAEKILREVQNKFGRTHSGTYLEMKTMAHKDNPLYKDVSVKLIRKAQEYKENLTYQFYRSVAYIQEEMTGETLLGDCGECAQAVQREFLLKNRTPTVNVVMEVLDKNSAKKTPKKNHVFNLSNIHEGVILENPQTWGNGAVVTDLWCGIAKKRDEALEYFKNLFNFNPENEQLVFKAMPDNQSSLQTAVIKHFKLDKKA